MKDKYLKRSSANPGAVLNTDSAGLDRYKKQKQKFKDMDTKINTLEERLKKLEELLTK